MTNAERRDRLRELLAVSALSNQRRSDIWEVFNDMERDIIRLLSEERRRT